MEKRVPRKQDDYKDEVLSLRRVTKVTKGGRTLHFSAFVAVGDGKGRVGIGSGKSSEVVEAIKKPDMEVTKIEVGETYLKISVSNVTKKDMEKYIKDIKKEYKNELSGTHPNTIYRASSDAYNMVDIKLHSAKAQGIIEYNFQ